MARMPGGAQTAARIRAFVEQYLLDEPFTGSDPLAEVDLDSLALEQLIDFIEETYAFHFCDEELVRENFQSLCGLAELVEHKSRLLIVGGNEP